VADAAGLDRFPLFGLSQGCAVSIAYAVQHPARVSHLILCGGFALGSSKRKPEERERRKALVTLMRLEWGADNPAIRQMFANYLMPGATKEQIDTFNELQQKTASAECAARYFEATGCCKSRRKEPDLESILLVQMLKIVLQPYLTKAHLVVTTQGVPAAAFRSPSGERQRTFACRKPCPDAQLLLRKWAGDRP